MLSIIVARKHIIENIRPIELIILEANITVLNYVPSLQNTHICTIIEHIEINNV